MIHASINSEGVKKLLLKIMNKEEIGILYDEKTGGLYFTSEVQLSESFNETVLLKTPEETCAIKFVNGKVESFSVLLNRLPIEDPSYKIIISSSKGVKGFKSQVEAAKFLGCVPSTVCKAIKNKKSINGWTVERRG